MLPDDTLFAGLTCCLFRRPVPMAAVHVTAAAHDRWQGAQRTHHTSVSVRISGSPADDERGIGRAQTQAADHVRAVRARAGGARPWWSSVSWQVLLCRPLDARLQRRLLRRAPQCRQPRARDAPNLVYNNNIRAFPQNHQSRNDMSFHSRNYVS